MEEIRLGIYHVFDSENEPTQRCNSLAIRTNFFRAILSD